MSSEETAETNPESQRKYQSLAEFLKSLGFEPKNIQQYQEAFTHASFSNENRDKGKDYDRWEFLGDAVLDLVVGDLVFRQHPDWPAGRLTRLRASIVEGKNLTEVALKLGFPAYIRFSKGEIPNWVNHKHIYEDVFESFIGVYYFQEGYSAAYELIKKTMEPYLLGEEQAGDKDWRSLLQEEIQAEFKSGVQYKIVDEKINGNDTSFTAVCMVDDVILGTGVGKNKKEAMTKAAKEALLSRRRQ